MAMQITEAQTWAESFAALPNVTETEVQTYRFGKDGTEYAGIGYVTSLDTHPCMHWRYTTGDAFADYCELANAAR